MKTITLGKLLREKDYWTYFYCSEKYQYYMSTDFKYTVKIKKSIVIRYLNNELTNCPFQNLPCNSYRALSLILDTNEDS